jgi:flagellar biosynthesis protein FliR
LVKSFLRSRSAGEPLADGLFTRFMLAPTFPLRALVIPEDLSHLLGFRLNSAPIIAVLMAFACMAGFGWVIELLERYFPQFNAFVLAHRMGFGIGLYITLVATWSGFWTAVMLNPRYEKFTSDLWRRRIRLDDFHRPDYR